MRAGVPIIPIAVVGAEESMPILVKVPGLAKALGVPYVPDHRQHAALLGPLGVVGYFPAKFKLRVLDPVTFDVPPDQPRYSRSRIMDESEAHPPADPGGALRHAPAAPLGLVRLSVGRRVLVTGLGTFWGGRVAQALEDDPDVDVIIGLDRDEPTVELERTEYVRSDENYSILSRIVKATKVDTIVHTFLVVDSTPDVGPARCTRSTSSAR